MLSTVNVFILPMRNGNQIEKETIAEVKEAFLSYL